MEENSQSQETRVAIIGIVLQNPDTVERMNSLLHDYSRYIIGRMGIPYREKNLNIVSVAIDAPQDTIAALTGKLGKLEGANVKTAYSNVISRQ